MKKLFYISILFSLCIGFSSCSDDDEPQIADINEHLVGEWFLTKYKFNSTYINSFYTIEWDIDNGDEELGICTDGEIDNDQELRPQRLIIEEYATDQFDFNYYRYNPNYSYWVVLYYGGIYSFTDNVFYDEIVDVNTKNEKYQRHEKRYVKELSSGKLVIIFETSSEKGTSKQVYTYCRY